MQLQEFLNAVRNMRKYQKAYFRDRKPSDLITAKNYEVFVDRGLSEGVTVTDDPVVNDGHARQETLFLEHGDHEKADQ
jgi:hypothetical protein